MKVRDIQTEADDLLKTVFKSVLASDDKLVWRKAFDAMNSWFTKKESQMSITDKESRDMFIWEAARNKLSKMYGKKFILPKFKK